MDVFDTLVEEQISKDGVVNLFGVMLYTDEHPNIKKVLRDDDYWNSFHEITGDSFCVFAVKPSKGYYDEPPKLPLGSTAFLTHIWREPSENKKLIEFFELRHTKIMPMLLLFTKVEGKYWKIELPLDDSNVESAHQSIREQLTNCCDAIDKISEENYKNSKGVYSAVSMSNDHVSFWKKIESGINLYEKLKGILT